MYKLWDELNAAKKLRWIELSHPLDNSSPFWSGIPEGSVELCKTVFDWGNPMLECLIQTFKFPGQFGTHIDFPGHFAHEGALSEAFGVQDFVFPLCVIDITEQVAKDCHYAVTADDVKAWEAAYGPIPDGAFVALRTDWSKRWPDMDALSGIAEDGITVWKRGCVLSKGRNQCEMRCRYSQLWSRGILERLMSRPRCRRFLK